MRLRPLYAIVSVALAGCATGSPFSEYPPPDGNATADAGGQPAPSGSASAVPEARPAPARCGDGITQSPEQCDDGNSVENDACTNACKMPAHGDGIVQTGEECDDGNAVDTDGCTIACKSAKCGDGIVHAGIEPCDDGNSDDTDGCTNACAPATCGDGFVQADVEQCDDGNAVDTDACRNNCMSASCGDGIVRPGVEACDDGNAIDTDACTNVCTAAACGDGVVQAGVEQCDDGNADDTDACRNNCASASCGDGVVQAGVEQCDDANSINDDACSNTCRSATCGDGIVQLAAGESCDDGNATSGDGCSATCHSEPFSTTASVMISGAMTCTTATANAARKIAVDGSGNVFAAMACDGSGYVATSTTRGVSFSAPVDLTADIPGAAGSTAHIAVATGPSRVAYAALQLWDGSVYLRTTVDAGVTWSAANLVGMATSTSAGLSLGAFNDDVYVGFATNAGIAVARNSNRGIGTFETTSVAMSVVFFDLLYDVKQGTLAVCADTPDFHVRASSDRGATFAAEVNPPGMQFYSDWAIGNGKIFVTGTNGASSAQLIVIGVDDLGASVAVDGLPVVNTSQTRTVGANDRGDAFVSSQLDSGGIQLDRLTAGATQFDAPRTISASGSSPMAAPLPAGAGAAVIFTEGTSVWVTVQAY